MIIIRSKSSRVLFGHGHSSFFEQRSDDETALPTATPLSNFLPTLARGSLLHNVRFRVQHAYIHGRSLVESGLGLERLSARSERRDRS
ncbi:hypothetical protein AVEN_222217-1 [Araneus ventricosus]|uniref:Uncharacterized protein n=1 Tax=Araneus ventricosus TaxID=182803 RepID=A0A4Y2VM78_ARAVE|nr:hypothetical protein AVEN_222217-1 [Araneus ventricosus]